MEYTIPKGVFDILPEEPVAEDRWRNSDHWQYAEGIIRALAHEYGFKEIRTPVFERTELFVRGVGESSDIVSKEMYTFLDKGERSMTLRPEGTASVMRAFVEKRLYNAPGIHKYFYICPMFRYERPQAGRYRQHHQFGAEAIGVGTPEQDVEVIDLLVNLYKRLGLKSLSVTLNSVGDASCREPYKAALTEYLRPHFDQLSAESQVRFTKNILRILDSKDPNDQKLLEKAPSILDFLNSECQDHFEEVKKWLKKLGISFTVNAKLVRGLDYYNKTVFEVVSGELGAQNAIGGGGRYDGLPAALGGPNLPCVGFGTGIERILQTMVKQNAPFPPAPHPFIFLIGLGEAGRHFCFDLLCQLRHQKISAEMELAGKKVQSAMQLASSAKADFCLVIGDQELEQKSVKLKNMHTRESEDVGLHDIASFLLNKKNQIEKGK